MNTRECPETRSGRHAWMPAAKGDGPVCWGCSLRYADHLREELDDAEARDAIRRAEIDRITEQRNRYRRELERAANHLEDAQAIVDPSRYLKAAERQVRGVLEVDL